MKPLVFQIWGHFTQTDRLHPTTVSMFVKDQLMGDGTKMIDFEQRFAAEDGEVVVLMREFEVPTLGWPDEEDEERAAREYARAVYNAYMDGWWNIIQKDPHGHGKNKH